MTSTRGRAQNQGTDGSRARIRSSLVFESVILETHGTVHIQMVGNDYLEFHPPV